MQVTLYADYAPWPLWSNGLLDENALSLSDETTDRIKACFNAYADPPRPHWPLWTPPEGTVGPDDEEAAWVAEGEPLREVIQPELAPHYEVAFDA